MEKRPFSGRPRQDWGNTSRAATAGLGSKGLKEATLCRENCSSGPILNRLKLPSKHYIQHCNRIKVPNILIQDRAYI